MKTPEKPEGINQPDIGSFPDSHIEGNKNQTIASMSGGVVIGSVGGNFTMPSRPAAWPVEELPACNSFIGRKNELAEIEQVLTRERQPGTPAISAISGMAGQGKSAFAIKAAHQVKEQFPDAQLYVDLRGADAQPRTTNDVLGEWLRTFGLKGNEVPDSLSERQRVFRSQLANRKVLLVLDNAHDEAQVRPLLPGSEDCAVIVTSRPSLIALTGAKQLELPALSLVDALELLSQLIGRVRVEKELAAAGEIVRLCDYLPLAIELVGGVLNQKSKHKWALEADYLPKLRDEQKRLDQLKYDGSKDLRACFDLSYLQLSDTERRFFALMAVMPADFSTDLARVISELKVDDVEGILEKLVNLQLIETLDIQPAKNVSLQRYSYHILIRLYAKEKLDQLGNSIETEAKERVVQWCLRGSESRTNAFNPVKTESFIKEKKKQFLQESLKLFEIERFNLLTVFDWTVAQKEHDKTIPLAFNLSKFFYHLYDLESLERINSSALSAARELGDREAERSALNNIGNVYKDKGKWEDSIEYYEASLEVSESIESANIEEKDYKASTLTNLGNVYKLQGQWKQAEARYRQALEICRDRDDKLGEEAALIGLGNVLKEQGHWQAAIEKYDACLEICRSLDDYQSEATVRINLGLVFQSQSRWDDAIEQFNASLDIYRDLNDEIGKANALGSIGLVYHSRGLWKESIEKHQKSLEIFQEKEFRLGEASALHNLGNVYRSQELCEKAIQHLQRSLDIFQELGDQPNEAAALHSLGNAYELKGDLEGAKRLYHQSIELFRSLGNRQDEGAVLNSLGSIYQAQNCLEEAIEKYEASVEIKRSLGDRHGESKSLNNLGNVYHKQNRLGEAIAAYRKSIKIKQNLGDRYGEGQTLCNLGDAYRTQGQIEETISAYIDGLEIFRDLSCCQFNERKALNALIDVYRTQGRWNDAIRQYEISLNLCRRIGNQVGEAEILGELGTIYNQQENWTEAISKFKASLELLSDPENQNSRRIVLYNLGNSYRLSSRWEEAAEQYVQSLEISRSLCDQYSESFILTNLGLVHQAQRRWLRAMECYKRSLEISHSLGNQHDEGIALANIGTVHQLRLQYAKALEYWQAAKEKIHPDSPAAKQLEQKLQNPYNVSKKQLLIGCIPQLALLVFVTFNLFRGHWLIALLILLAWASFLTYRVWRVRRGRS